MLRAAAGGNLVEGSGRMSGVAESLSPFVG